ncbi:MAG: hypothetical protein HJJLKODD_01562 [Phycisphaerae bacterium]|nr:hypothetical protein [Phycisphaerae bacterium]
MLTMQAITQLAENQLLLRQENGQADRLLWEQAQRTSRAVELICGLLGSATNGVDREALQIAAIFHPLGWVLQVTGKVCARYEIFSRPLTDIHRELRAVHVQSLLDGRLPVKRLEMVCRFLRENGRHADAQLGTQILNDACELEQIGSMALWLMMIRHNEEGRSIQDLLITWERQRDYHFWPARIRDSFRFEQVRRLAYQRLEILNQFMAQLARETELADLQDLIRNPNTIQSLLRE